MTTARTSLPPSCAVPASPCSCARTNVSRQATNVSCVEVATEAPTIAGVFVNRLKLGMRLQTDPTLIYHPERTGLVPTRTHRRDATNPYNTYAHDGLPPGPICSPTRQAIEATLAPARHDFLYFCARRDGTGRHAFARTLARGSALRTPCLAASGARPRRGASGRRCSTCEPGLI